VGNCTDQGIEILSESVRRAVQIYEDKFNWCICHNNLKPKQLVDLVALAEHFGIRMVKQSSRQLPISQSSMGSPKSGSEFDWDGSRVGGTLWKLCPARETFDVHEIIMDNDVVLTEALPEIDEFLASSDKCLILQDNVKFYGLFSNYVESEVALNTGLIGLPPNYYFADDIGEMFYQVQSQNSGHDFDCLSQADEQGMIAAVISKKDHIVISNAVIVELLSKTSEQRYSGRGGDGTTKKHLTSYRRFCESIFSPHRKGYHFCQANRTDAHFAWELYKKFQEHGAGILASFGNKEAERIARRGYIEGHLGSKALAKNWSQTYADRRLAMAKSELDS
jgi:hypothetical protein